MSVNRIVDPLTHTDGWQARWPIPGEGRRRWTRFFSVKTHGGIARSYDLAVEAERQFRKRARLEAGEMKNGSHSYHER